MAHRHDIYRYGPEDKYIEHEYKCKGNFGAKGEERAEKKKATPEQIKKQNQWNRERMVLRIIRDNFEPGDLWTTLKFPKGTKITAKGLKSIWKKFIRKVRAVYKKRKTVLKYVYRMEIGERGGAHIHILIKRLIGTPGTADVLAEIWQEFGRFLNYTPVYEDGEFVELAKYITKPLKEDIAGQLNLFGEEEDCKVFMKYDRSRNMTLPEKETHVYKRRTIRKLVENGPQPKPGYYIDRDSIRYGTNQFTGMTYFYYTEIRLTREESAEWKAGGDG